MTYQTFEFFLRGQKVHAACIKSHAEKNLIPLTSKNIGSQMPQKKYLTQSLRIEKSQKIKLFVDFISKNVIRMSLYCKVYISFGKRDFESLEKGMSRKSIMCMGVGVHAFFDFYKNGVYNNE